MPEINRRQLIKTGLTVSAAAVAGTTALSACSNKGRGGVTAQSSTKVKLPKFVRYNGVKPDYVGTNGVQDAAIAYPANPVKAATSKPGDGKPVSALVMTNSPAPPALKNNKYWQTLNKRMGFDFQIELVPFGDWSQRFQTAVAGDKLPDVFALLTGSIASLPNLLEQKAVDLTPHLSGDAVTKYPFLANIPTESWNLTTYGGKIFGVPIPRGAQSSGILYGRQDLLSQQGINERPNTLADFQALCQQLTAKQANHWALGRAPLGWVRQAHGIANSWSLQNGKLVSALEDERQKDALEATRQLVAKKVVHPDAFTAQNSDWKTWMANGTIWLVDDTFSAMPGFYLYPSIKSFRLLYWGPPSVNGGDASIWLGNPNYSMTAINANSADRIEALLSVLNYLAAPFGTEEYRFKHYGVEGVDYKLKGTDPVMTQQGTSETQLSLSYLAEGPWVTYQPGHAQATKDAFEAQSRLVPKGIANPVLGLYSDTDIRKGAQIGLGDLENDILQGRQPVSKWDAGVAEWKRKGGDKIRDEYQKALDERNGK
jgi:putative aldouronate transport system substrate-binding protein